MLVPRVRLPILGAAGGLLAFAALTAGTALAAPPNPPSGQHPPRAASQHHGRHHAGAGTASVTHPRGPRH